MKQRIGIVFDWDHTCSPMYMEGPIFTHYGIPERAFWEEVHRRAHEDTKYLNTRVFVEHEYLNYLVECACNGTMKDLDNPRLTEIGCKIPTFPGLDTIIKKLDELGAEVHIVTSGLRAMLLEHPAIKPIVQDKNIQGAEFLDYTWETGLDGKPQRVPQGHIVSVAKTLLPSDKVRVLEEIAKGCAEFFYDACVPLPPDQYLIPYKNMIYVGDGVSDIYAFEQVPKYGGFAVGVYANAKGFKQMEIIRKDGFLDILGIADYREEATVGNWLINKVLAIKDRIAAEEAEIEDKRIAELRTHAPEYLFPWSK